MKKTTEQTQKIVFSKKNIMSFTHDVKPRFRRSVADTVSRFARTYLFCRVIRIACNSSACEACLHVALRGHYKMPKMKLRTP